MPANMNVWNAALAAFRATYDAEVARLTDEYRTRILAGEFSGTALPPAEEPRVFRLERELKRHPMLRTVRDALAVIGVSHWMALNNSNNCVQFDSNRVIRESAAECLAHDIMYEAVERGWVKRPRGGKLQYEVSEPYALKVA